MSRHHARNALASLGIGFIVYALVHFIAGFWHHPGVDALALPVGLALTAPAVAVFWHWMGSGRSDVEAEAWSSVWLHGNWYWLTRCMTTEEREHAAAAVERSWSAAEADDPGLDHAASRKRLWWWRDPSPLQRERDRP